MSGRAPFEVPAGVAELLKRCRGCGHEKPAAAFAKRSRRGLQSRCRACASDTNAAWYRANRDARMSKAHAAKLRRYGLTVADYDAMLEAQGGVCRTCGRPESKRQRGAATPDRLTVDHCHRTGRVRGLLCHACNTGVGVVENSPDPAAVLAAWRRYLGF